MSNRILIAGAAGVDNAGDEATTQTMVRHLRERIPGVQITLVSGDPPSAGPGELADAVRETGLVILAGGIFQDCQGFDPGAILTREHRGLSFYLAPALLAAACAKPLMLYAVGAGPLNSEQGRLYTKVAGDIAARITVRDGASRELFVSLGVSPEKISVTADPCFDFAPAPELPGLAAVREWKSGGPAVAVCLRTGNVEVAAALDDFLLDEGGRILFVPLGGSDDLEAARGVYAQMRFRERAAILEQPCTAAALATILAHADLVLGMRLHSLIFSLAARVPFVALESEPTVGGLADLTGLREFTLPFGGTEAYVIAGRLRWALRQKARFQAMAVDDLRRRTRENADIAAALLRQGTTAADYGPDARGAIGQLVMALLSRSEAGGQAQLALDLEIARNARQETAAQLALCQQLLARYESKTFAGIAKRALGLFRSPTGN